MTFRSITVALIGDPRHLDRTLQTSSTGVNRFGSDVEKAGLRAAGGLDKADAAATRSKASIEKLGTGLTIVGVTAAAAFGKMVGSAADFDAAMSAAQAGTQATGAALGTLRQAAIEAGALTVFSATEAAHAIEEMGKANVSIQAILGGGLRGALDLAAAGQLDVAQAAGIMATALQQFEEPGTAARHVADLLAAAAGKAQGDVTDMGQALKFVGPVAHQMGISIEETSGVIAELATNGILADQAGTSLRGMLLSLSSPSAKAAALMQQLGIHVYDARGSFVGFRGVAAELQKALGGLTNAQRDAALGVLFGNEQVTSARILYAGGATAVDQWTKAVDDQGFAAQTAATKLDNLKGDVEALSGSLDTAFIEGGSQATGLLRGLTQAATGTVNAYSGLPAPVQAVTTTVVGLTAAFGTVGGAALLVVPKLAATRAALTATEAAAARTRSTMLGVGAAFAAITVASSADALGDWAGRARVATVSANKLAAAFSRSGRGNFLDPKALDVFDNHSLFGFSNDATDAAEALNRFGAEAHKALDEGWNARLGRLQDVGQSTGAFNKRVGELDVAFSAMVAHGDTETATFWLNRFLDAAREHGVDIDRLRAKFPKFTEALAQAKSGTQEAAAAAREQAAAYAQQLSPAVEDATSAVDDYKDSLDNLNSVNIAAFRQQIALKRAFGDVREAIGKSSTVTLDEKSALADLADQANETAKAMVDQGKSQQQANRVLRDSRLVFLDAAEQMGYTRRQARDLADQLLTIPTTTEPKVQPRGLDKALSDSGKLRDLLSELDGTRATAQVQVKVSAGKLRQLTSLAAVGPALAAGGAVRGPGGATSDSILAAVSNGEHVWTAAEVRAAGGHDVMEAWRRAVRGAGSSASVPGYAAGGRVEVRPQQQVVLVRTPVSESRTNQLFGGDLHVSVERTDQIAFEVEREMRRLAWSHGGFVFNSGWGTS